MLIKLRNGLNIPMMGAPEAISQQGSPIHSVALLGEDYTGLKPRLLVEAGDHVHLGQPIFFDKRDPEVKFTTPASGIIRSINRGARRALQSIIIDLDQVDDDAANSRPLYPEFAGSKPGALTPQKIRSALCKSGLWTAFRTRPYCKVPQSDSTATAIFVTAIDTRPLAGSPALVVAQHPQTFSHGLQILARLTAGPVFVCTAPEWNLTIAENQQVRHVQFAGPHPAGLPGTHIHHLNPVGTGQTVWHIGYQDVIAIGKLFDAGTLWTERTIALGGNGFTRPRLITTRLGASIADMVDAELTNGSATPQRIVSGSVLDGRTATGAEAYLGRYHLQVSAIKDVSQRKLFGWLGLFDGNYSFANRLARRQSQATLHEFSTARYGRPTALIPIVAFDRILPMDILPVPLLRALLIGDTDQAQALGCLELAAEDLALCSFVCPGKNDYGAALKINLKQIERDG